MQAENSTEILASLPTVSSETGLILVGEIVAPFGVRGEVKVVPLMDDPKHLTTIPAVHLVMKSGQTELRRVERARPHQEAWVFTFADITDRNTTEALRGARLFVRREELPPLDQDTFYKWQLIGLRVVTESGVDLGHIQEVHFYRANDVYETPEALIPAVADEVVVRVSLDEGILVVRDIPGLRKDED